MEGGRVIVHLFKRIHFKIQDFNAIARLKYATNHTKRAGIIRVCFVSQMLEVWDKQAAVFEGMLKDDRFDPVILCLPMFDYVTNGINPDDNTNAEFFAQKYGKEYIIEYHNSIDCDRFEFDYFFYDRPYNWFYPDKLRSNRISLYSRICMVNYCTADMKGVFTTYQDFAKDVAIWFASNNCEFENYKKSRLITTSVRKVYNIGYPAFEYYSETKANSKSSIKQTILWTPRWTDSYDSHFLEYYESFIEFIKMNPDYKLIIRPHPLMFQNYISKGILSSKEVDTIKQRCDEEGIVFDSNKIIRDTFDNTDILVSDYSSVLSLFMLTGKPIVYCPMSQEDDNDIFAKLKSGFYEAESFDKIGYWCNRLKNGDDFLKTQRALICKQCLSPTEGIVDKVLLTISDDYKKYNH